MKKILSTIGLLLISIALVGCSCMKRDAKMAVEDFLNQYRNLSSDVLEDLEDTLEEENLTEEQKETYRKVLKKEYQDLKYEIKDVTYDDDTALVETKITVYDLYKVQSDANDYLTEHTEEFTTDGVFNNSLFMDYKLSKMESVKDTVDYTIIFNTKKSDDGNYTVVDVTDEDIEKIHGIYDH